MWNDHDSDDPFTKAFDELILALPDAAAAELLRCPAGEVLFRSPLFERVECRRFPNEQILDEEGFIGLRVLRVVCSPGRGRSELV